MWALRFHLSSEERAIDALYDVLTRRAALFLAHAGRRGFLLIACVRDASRVLLVGPDATTLRHDYLDTAANFALSEHYVLLSVSHMLRRRSD
jgi:hypothetical protein